MKSLSFVAALLLAGSLASGCAGNIKAEDTRLAGAWHGHLKGTSGWLAAMKDLQFMYVFNKDGTMTESSNYDAYPPGPPAYGVWQKTGPRRFDAKYEVFLTKAVGITDEIAKGNGWSPNGYGILRETLTLSEDGNAFDSTLRFELYDAQGKPVDGGGTATNHAVRIRF